ncbi:MAG: ATP-binding protein [Myxococcota bacterium]
MSNATDWRASVARTILITAASISAVATAVIVLNSTAGPRRTAMGLIGGATALVAGVTVFVERRSTTRQAWVAAAALVVSGLVGYVGVGFLAGPAMVTTCGVITAALLLGRRATAALIAGVTLVLVVLAALAVSGTLMPPDAHDTAFDTPRGWLRTTVVTVGVLVILGTTITHAVGWLERALATAREETRLRAEADQKRAEAERAAQDARRLELVGRLAAAVAHDFNNALLVIRMSADLIAGPNAGPADVLAAARDISDATRDAGALTRKLLVLGGREARQPRTLSLRGIVDDYRATIARVLPADVALVVEHRDDAWAVVDELQLHQVLLNLVVNARDALGADPRLVLRTRIEELASARPAGAGASGELPAGRYAVLEVEDNGVGMAPETRARAFEPFFTTKVATGGTGLGLASVLAIAEQSGGRVVLESEVARGTRVALWLPAVAAIEAPVRAPEPAAAARPLAGLTVLVAEDEPSILRIQTRALEGAGAKVRRATDGDAALAEIREGGVIDVLCTDAIMPGAPVSKVIAAFEDRYPAGAVVVCSGHVEEALLRRGIEAGRYLLMPKPFGPQELVEAIRARAAASADRSAAPAA